ncbi:MAG: hypothetical protein QW199_00505 [Candidatus Pacearchaeota archaeon]
MKGKSGRGGKSGRSGKGKFLSLASMLFSMPFLFGCGKGINLEGRLERVIRGKAVVVRDGQLIPERVKICNPGDDLFSCDAESITYSSYNGDFELKTKSDKLLIFEKSDELPDGYEKVKAKAKETDIGKVEIECKKKKDFNCFIALDKQNYCSGESMGIEVTCKNNAATPYNLEIRFVNEKDKLIYDKIGKSGPVTSWETTYLIPLTWPLTNSREGADWKAYLYSISEKYGESYEDKDNFNLLDICSTPPDQLSLAIVIENGKGFVNYRDVNVSYIPSSEAEQLARCVTEGECVPTSYEQFRDNEVISLPGGSGEKRVYGKAKKAETESDIASDSIILDVDAPTVQINARQENLDNGDVANDVLAEICISDNYGIESAEASLYGPGNELIQKSPLELIPDQSCAKQGEIGYKASINFNNMPEGGDYTIVVDAKDLATNKGSNQATSLLDLTPPAIALNVLDHLLKTYVIYPPQSSSPTTDAETQKGLDGSEFRYAHKYANGQQSCDSAGNCYDGKLDIKIEASDESGLEKIVVDWGDGSIEEFPGNITRASHAYARNSMEETGDYSIKAKACDVFNNCSESGPKKVKIVMTQEDADLAFWSNVYPSVPGLSVMEMYGYDCDKAIKAGYTDRCIQLDDSWRRVNMSSLGADFVNDFYQPGQKVGHVYITPEKHDHVGDNNYNYASYCIANVPSESGLANCEIATGLNVWYRARGPPHPIPIIPTDYGTFTSRNCNLPADGYEKLYCAYKFEDDRGDF